MVSRGAPLGASDGGQGRTVVNLRSLVEALPPEECERFQRLMSVGETVGRLVAPAAMEGWISKLFGSVEAVERQAIVKITNQVTMEGTLFNALRASRPIEAQQPGDLEELVNSGRGDPFCTPLEGTPE